GKRKCQEELKENALERTTKRIASMGSASGFAEPEHWIPKLNRPDPPLLNCRPPQNFDVPVVLYHSVFGEFLKNCEYYQTSADDKNMVCDLLWTMSGTFKNKDARVLAFREWATTFFVRDTTSYVLGQQRVDGVWIKEYSGRSVLLTILEFKNECSQRDPYMQASAYYAKYFEQVYAQKTSILLDTCLPTFLVYLYEPYIGIAEILAKQNDADFLCFTVTTLSQNAWTGIETRQASFPYLHSYQSISEETVDFVYTERIDSKHRKLVFHVEESKTTTKRILKFVTSYNAEVHKFCFSKGIAPELVCIGDIMNADYKFVVMEDLIGFDVVCNMWNGLNEQEKTDLKAKILEAKGILHDNRLVHGDLRPVNIMAKYTNEEWVIKLVDFDWSGKEGEATYPQFLNTKIPWHPDVKRLGPIWCEHDTYLLEESFRKLE
ncbi:5111_t:CDS:2, partial [Paraglomus brasilianum]